ncbi:MAG: hypothetical protein E7131_05000 [Rikenellaceae bacterium]|nr:hypothetical protein [Rikenellaceae bacterium]
MKTKQPNNNFQELDRRVEQILTPRFAPLAEEIKLRKPKNSIWLNTIRLTGIAAAIIIGVYLIIPTNKIEAMTPEDIVFSAIEDLQKSNSFRVTFTAKVKPAPEDDNDYYRITPDGKPTKGVLTIAMDETSEVMRIEWESGVTQLYDGSFYHEWEGTTKTDRMQCRIIINKFLSLLDLEQIKSAKDKEYIKIYDVQNSDNILITAQNPDFAINRVRLEGTFSKRSGKLTEGKWFELKDNEWVETVTLHNIEYGFPITIEEVCATPKTKR